MVAAAAGQHVSTGSKPKVGRKSTSSGGGRQQAPQATSPHRSYSMGPEEEPVTLRCGQFSRSAIPKHFPGYPSQSDIHALLINKDVCSG